MSAASVNPHAASVYILLGTRSLCCHVHIRGVGRGGVEAQGGGRGGSGRVHGRVGLVGGCGRRGLFSTAFAFALLLFTFAFAFTLSSLRIRLTKILSGIRLLDISGPPAGRSTYDACKPATPFLRRSI